MTNAAASVLKKALKDAEQARDRVKRETADDIEKGRVAGLKLEAAEDTVHELTVALDMLDRPMMERVPQSDPEGWVRGQQGEPEITVDRVTPPDGEERVVAGVSIRRRSAEG